MLTVDVAALSIELPSLYSPLHPFSPKANAQAEVNLPPIRCNLTDSSSPFSAFLSLVEGLRICVTPTSSWQNVSDREDWLKVIHAFGGTEWFHLDGNSGFTAEIALALQSSENLLPALHKLCIREPVSHFTPLRDSCHFIGVNYERRQRQFIYRLDGIGTTFVKCQF